jgi:hypothetical protein
VQPEAAQAAAAAADQTAQEIRVHSVVTSCHLAIIGQPLSGAVELLLADDGGHGADGDPLGRVYRLRSTYAAAANWKQGRATPLRRVRVRAVGEDLTEIGRVGQDTVQGGGVPFRVSPRRDDAELGETLLQAIDRHALVGKPTEQLATTVASAASSRTPAGSRGRSGSRR